MNLLNLALGLALSALVGYVGYRRQALTRSGVVGAVLVGTPVLGLGGWDWGVLLVAFFASSSLLSHYRQAEKAASDELLAKTARRDLGQALANGGWAALLAVAYGVQPDPLLSVAFVGALATVTADTWATELGMLSPTPPRLITSGQPVPAGTSGGVSLVGTLAALAGAAGIGLVAAGLGLAGAWRLALLPVAAVTGLAGSLFDSLLGATVQGVYRSPAGGETERRGPELVRGWRWLANDGVNFLASVAGSAVAVGLVALFGG